MQNSIKFVVILLATLLFLWLVWGFWPLGNTVSLFLSALAIVIAGVAWYWRFKQQKHSKSLEKQVSTMLPPASYQQAIVLVCGQSEALFPNGLTHRETSQAWYVSITSPAMLLDVTQTVVETAPVQLGQLSVLFAVLPEQLVLQETLTQEMLNWRRAISESRSKAGVHLPFWVSLYLSPIQQTDPYAKYRHEERPWLTLLNHQREFQVEQNGSLVQPLSEWVQQFFTSEHQQLHTMLSFDYLLDWLQQVFTPQLTVEQAGVRKLVPSAWAIQFIPITSVENNSWQQFITRRTGLAPLTSTQNVPLLPLPDILLTRLHHDISLNRYERLMGAVGIICGLFLVGALSGSYHNNRQLVRHVGEDTARFIQLSDTPLAPKLVTYQQLQTDAVQLSHWQREGVPTGYSLALYQGSYLLPHLHVLLSSWAPPAPPAPVIVQEASEMVSLDSLSLFDVGQYTLKPSATKVLIDALIHIRAKSGWLIVVSGYTDNTGNPVNNQKLSLQRAESVRDWMIQTSDIAPSCFAVQGNGQANPIASNNTAEGRAKNRRVEIRLMPQVDACQASNE